MCCTRSTDFFTQIKYVSAICAKFFMSRPKTYFNCHLQHLFGLLSTRRQRQNHAAPPSLTQEYKVNAPWWKPSGCHRENAFLYFFLQMLYFCFCLLVFCFFIWRTDPPSAQVFAEWWLWQKAGFRSKGFLCLPSTG